MIQWNCIYQLPPRAPKASLTGININIGNGSVKVFLEIYLAIKSRQKWFDQAIPLWKSGESVMEPITGAFLSMMTILFTKRWAGWRFKISALF